MSKPSAYSKVAAKKVDADDHLKRTRARIQQIQSHLSKTPRGSRLKGKVCVITGVGSMKGIGYVSIHRNCWAHLWNLNAIVDRRAAALLYAHEGSELSQHIFHYFANSGPFAVQGPSIYTWSISRRIIFLISSPRSRNRTLMWRSAQSSSVTNSEFTIITTGYHHRSRCGRWRSNSRSVSTSLEGRREIRRFLRECESITCTGSQHNWCVRIFAIGWNSKQRYVGGHYERNFHESHESERALVRLVHCCFCTVE